MHSLDFSLLSLRAFFCGFRGATEKKKMGWLGFALLALGFVLQTYINFI
jgi:hypothetical protein